MLIFLYYEKLNDYAKAAMAVFYSIFPMVLRG